jgi:hypothetical protein
MITLNERLACRWTGVTDLAIGLVTELVKISRGRPSVRLVSISRTRQQRECGLDYSHPRVLKVFERGVVKGRAPRWILPIAGWDHHNHALPCTR